MHKDTKAVMDRWETVCPNLQSLEVLSSFPTLKKQKGVSNFLVMLSSSSTHCWVNIRERGEEKWKGRKEEGENENEGN